MKEPRVAIIILNWNGYQVTKDCLTSLFNIDYQEYIVTLVDNGSKDKSVEKLKTDFSTEKKLNFLILDKNHGFTGGNNRGLEFASSEFSPDYYLLLNNDTIVTKDFLGFMVNASQKDVNCYAVVPKILYHDMPQKIWFAGGQISKLTGVVKHFGLNKKDVAQYDLSKRTGFMNGCCALISKNAITEIGILDDQFFANSEDADYSLRIIESGHTIQYTSQAIIYHKVSHSFKSNKGKWLAFYLAARGIVLLQKKHLSKRQLPIFYAVFSIRWVMYLTIKLLLLNDIESIKGIYKGTFDGIRNRIRFVV